MRAVLLSDSQVKEVLTNKVVPVWESVREVPKVTIDFGKGKKLERTLKGNTVMYLCSPEGRVIDAYPGVYTPQHFLEEMNEGLAQVKAQELDKWHRAQVMSDLGQDPAEMTMSKMYVESPLLKMLSDTELVKSSRFARPRTVEQPVQISATKRVLESPLARNGKGAESTELGPISGPPDMVEAFEKLTSKLVDVSDQPMSAGEARARSTGLSGETNLTPEQLGQLAVARDSKQNVRFVRPAVHMLLATFSQPPTPAEIKDVIFKKVLHVKIDDPYLGLDDVAVPGTKRGG